MPAYDPRLFSPPAPVATVIVRHQESGVKVTDVPMLLDLGADVTLIPRTSAELLGLSLEAGLHAGPGEPDVRYRVGCQALCACRGSNGRPDFNTP